MGKPGASAGGNDGSDLRASSTGLTKLAGDLGDMQDHLDKQIKRMDELVDRIEAGWRGPAGTAYREFHRAAAADAVRIREVMKGLEQAVRMSRDGFSSDDLQVLERVSRIRVDVAGEVDRLSTPNTGAADVPARPRSSLEGF
ncbi:WXG100 family type VII secretion target [Streptomyces sp. MS06]|uniref:WXG100 family type VII secretion target n=1 Tax=Streptomyces sp. MS06 TaxID=3385974 RepID=UPI0039A19C77